MAIKLSDNYYLKQGKTHDKARLIKLMNNIYPQRPPFGGLNIK